MTICTPQAGAVIPAATEMSSGSAGTGTKCTGVFTYTVGATDLAVVTGYSTRVMRQCRWCDGTANSGVNEVYIKDFVPPTTSTRLLKGVTVWATSTAGAMTLT